LTHADAVTVASRTLESIVWATGVSGDSVFYVPNGVWDGRDVRPERGHEGGRRILLYTRFFEFPVSRVIDVFRLVQERVPRAQLLIVGEGLHGEEEELFDLAADAGLTVRRSTSEGAGRGEGRAEDGGQSGADILYAGWVSSKSLPSFFSQATVAIYPFDDTLVNRTKCAMKLVDLLAAGVPVVAEAVGQNREYVRHGETGLLVEPGDVPVFAESVVRLLKDDALRCRLGRSAARDLRLRFHWEKLVVAVEDAYRGTE
jgi:glycosyltransferase involved in cell wall biosynthesis